MLPDIKYRLTMKSNKTDLCFLLVLVVILILVITQKKENLRVKKHKKKKYNPDDFRRYRKKISEEIKRKELNRDFNYEVPLFYKTPYQYLDFQDLQINEYDRVYNAKPEDINSKLLVFQS